MAGSDPMKRLNLSLKVVSIVRNRSGNRGFTLIEVMVVVAIIGILAAVAYPSYLQSVTKTRRTAAQGCMLEMAQFMERFYTTNLRYDQTGAGVAVALANPTCRADMAAFYTFSFPGGQPTQTTYTIQAVPQGGQAAADVGCGTLTLTQAGTKGRTGANAMNMCWQ
jgi:type IV pilus assembly protein PilE